MTLEPLYQRLNERALEQRKAREAELERRILAGDMPKPPKPPRRFCKHGHPWVPENVCVMPDGRKQCRICKRRRNREYLRRIRRQA